MVPRGTFLQVSAHFHVSRWEGPRVALLSPFAGDAGGPGTSWWVWWASPLRASPRSSMRPPACRGRPGRFGLWTSGIHIYIYTYYGCGWIVSPEEKGHTSWVPFPSTTKGTLKNGHTVCCPNLGKRFVLAASHFPEASWDVGTCSFGWRR